MKQSWEPILASSAHFSKHLLCFSTWELQSHSTHNSVRLLTQAHLTTELLLVPQESQDPWNSGRAETISTLFGCSFWGKGRTYLNRRHQKALHTAIHSLNLLPDRPKKKASPSPAKPLQRIKAEASPAFVPSSVSIRLFFFKQVLFLFVCVCVCVCSVCWSLWQSNGLHLEL